jgi:hypothetical protein
MATAGRILMATVRSSRVSRARFPQSRPHQSRPRSRRRRSNPRLWSDDGRLGKLFSYFCSRSRSLGTLSVQGKRFKSPVGGNAAWCKAGQAAQWMRQTHSTRRRFRLAEPAAFDHSRDAHAIDTVLRNFFDAHHPSPPADKCMGAFFQGRHNRKSDLHSYAEHQADPEVKAMSRNIACPTQDRLELLEVGLEPDFDLKV